MGLNILAIAPYQSLGDLFLKAAGQYENFAIDVAVFNLQEAADYIAKLDAGRYDMIVSRGGTAQMLRKTTELPIIEIGVSVYDMLRIIQMAQQSGRPFAIVGFENVTRIANVLCDILAYKIPVVEISGESNAEARLSLLKAEGMDLIVGDVISTNVARKIGIHSLLITSGQESVDKALDECLSLNRSLKSFTEYNQAFKGILELAPFLCYLMDAEGRVSFSNQDLSVQVDPELVKYTQTLLPELTQVKKLTQTKRIGRMQYNISARAIHTRYEELYGFYISEPVLSARICASCISISQLPEDDLYAEGFPEKMTDRILLEKAVNPPNNAPIHLTGAIGAGHDSLARYIHMHSKRRASSFMTVNCSQLNEKSFSSIVSSDNNPFNMEGYTLYFKDLHLLTQSVQEPLLNYLKDSGLRRRHQLVSSSYADMEGLLREGLFLAELYNMLCVLLLPLTPLAERREDIPAIINLFINRYNMEYGKQIIGVENEGMKLMAAYGWPNNIDELKKIIRHLVIATDMNYIPYESVRKILTDKSAGIGPVQSEIDFSQPLESIERDIIKNVLVRENMNQSRAAQSLGISRSTLWRKVKNVW